MQLPHRCVQAIGQRMLCQLALCGGRLGRQTVLPAKPAQVLCLSMATISATPLRPMPVIVIVVLRILVVTVTILVVLAVGAREEVLPADVAGNLREVFGGPRHGRAVVEATPNAGVLDVGDELVEALVNPRRPNDRAGDRDRHVLGSEIIT